MINAEALAAWAEYRSIVQGPALAVVDRVWPAACGEARIAVAPHTLAQAWAECQRADWMLGLAVRAGVDRRLAVRAACACARAVLHLVTPGEDHPRVAIETAEAWSRGEATIEQVRAAACAAEAAAWAAQVGAAGAATGAAWATMATGAAWATMAAWAAGEAARAATGAAWAARAAAWAEAVAEMSAIVRGVIAIDDLATALAAGREGEAP